MLCNLTKRLAVLVCAVQTELPVLAVDLHEMLQRHLWRDVFEVCCNVLLEVYILPNRAVESMIQVVIAKVPIQNLYVGGAVADEDKLSIPRNLLQPGQESLEPEPGLHRRQKHLPQRVEHLTSDNNAMRIEYERKVVEYSYSDRHKP